MDARLIVVGGKANKSEVKLKLPTTIGRSRAADLTVAHPKVSRQHCQIFERDGLLVVRDNGSLNGTYIEDTRITESVLKPGDKLTVGPLTFMAAYEPATANAVSMPTVDLPTPAFDPPAAAADVATVNNPLAVAADDAEAWFEDAADAEGAVAAPLPSMDEAAEPLEFDELVESPAVAASADDFQVAEPFSDLGETVPADGPWGEQLGSPETAANVPPTVVVQPQAKTPTPLSPDDFRLPDDEGSDTASEIPPAVAAGFPTELADSDQQPDFPPSDPPEQSETIAWSPNVADTPYPQAITETIGTAFDNTAEIQPSQPAMPDVGEPQETVDTSGDEVQAESDGKAGHKAADRRGWWPFGKKKGAAKEATPPAQDLPPIVPASPLPAEPTAVHTDVLTPIVEPEETPVEPPIAAASSETQDESSSSDDEELSQFLKSLGQ
jgi:predicted component of type VI protein secretion system